MVPVIPQVLSLSVSTTCKKCKFLGCTLEVGFPEGSMTKMSETWFSSLGWEDPLEKKMSTHTSILAWEIPWTEEPGALQPMWSQKSWTWLSVYTTTTILEVLNRKPWGVDPVIHALGSSFRWFWCTLKIENHCFTPCFLEQNKGRYNIFYFLDLICAIYTYILLHLLSV